MPGSQKNAKRGEPLGEAASAQFARDGSGEQHQARAGQRGSQADGGERTAEQRDLDTADEGDHRRDIDVSPRQMAGEREVVQLVYKVAVVAARVEVKNQLESGESGHQHSGSELPARAKFRHLTPGRKLPSSSQNARRFAYPEPVRTGGP